jgi:hypothetical protein
LIFIDSITIGLPAAGRSLEVEDVVKDIRQLVRGTDGVEAEGILVVQTRPVSEICN